MSKSYSFSADEYAMQARIEKAVQECLENGLMTDTAAGLIRYAASFNSKLNDVKSNVDEALENSSPDLYGIEIQSTDNGKWLAFHFQDDLNNDHACEKAEKLAKNYSIPTRVCLYRCVAITDRFTK